jgi:hypothetical protein
MMTPAKVVFCFLVGLVIGAFFVTVADRIYEGGWRGGPTIVGLSLPVTILYFLALWGVAVWRSWPLTGRGLMAAGFLCAIFPFFFGFFPVYYLRLAFAVPVALLQFALLIGAITLFAKFAHH